MKDEARNLPKWWAVAAVCAGIGGVAGWVWGQGGGAGGLGMAGSGAMQVVKLEPFGGLPEAKPAGFKAAGATGRVVAGTAGLGLAAPARTTGDATVAILGDLTPMNSAGDKYLKMAVAELNLLR